MTVAGGGSRTRGAWLLDGCNGWGVCPRGNSTVAGVNCYVVGGAIGVRIIVVAVGLVVVFEWGKRVVVTPRTECTDEGYC
jgi:hypothetical protein